MEDIFRNVYSAMIKFFTVSIKFLCNYYRLN